MHLLADRRSTDKMEAVHAGSPANGHPHGGSRTRSEVPTGFVDHPRLRLEKIDGISHRDTSILSVDFAFSQGKRRLASAGHDCMIRIWALDGVYSQGVCVSGVQCECLATLEEHIAPVNCVRWSPDCKLIASGDADGVLLVWSPEAGGAHAALKGAASAGSEPWHRQWLLRGHVGEICDISWHPFMHTRFNLASCSHDGTVRLWDVRKGMCVALLKAPDGGLIKGVAYDPLGQFLAAMSDATGASNQPTAILWECPDEEADATGAVWREVHVSQEPWSTPSPLGTAVYFRRPSWDPLGQALCLPYGERMRCKVSTPRYFGALFSRGSWDTPKLYRGHMQRVSVVRFSPVVFGPSGNVDKACVVFAMGSQDGVVSIWLSSYPAPLVVLTDLVDENCIITDISWSPDGQALAFASNDGAVGLIEISWGKAFDEQGRWSTPAVRRWCHQRRLEVIQPSWDLPVNSAHLSSGASKRPVDSKSDAALEQPSRRPRIEVDRWSSNHTETDHRSTGDSSKLQVYDGLVAPVTSTQKISCSPAKAGSHGLSLAASWDPAEEAPSGDAHMDMDAASSWDPPTARKVGPPPPGRWCIRTDNQRLELRVESIVDDNLALISQLARLTLVDYQSSDSCSVGLQARAPRCKKSIRWQLMVPGCVQCAAVSDDKLALGLGHGHSKRYELIILDSKSGCLLFPPICMKSPVEEVHMEASGERLLTLEESSRLCAWLLAGDSAPRCLFDLALPFFTETLEEVGFISSSTCFPFLRLEGGKVLAFHDKLHAWLVLDTSRYASSALQCHAPLDGPPNGVLSTNLWSWRCPTLPPDWCTISSAASWVSRDTHRDRLAHLSHQLASMSLLGSPAECCTALADLVDYCLEVDDKPIVSEIMLALGHQQSLKGGARILAEATARLGLDLKASCASQVWLGEQTVIRA